MSLHSYSDHLEGMNQKLTFKNQNIIVKIQFGSKEDLEIHRQCLVQFSANILIRPLEVPISPNQ